MHLHFERSPNTRCDCPLLSLTWMGKVPDEMPDEEGWKLNRTNYYQEGWLATGNVRGVVGVTFTSCHCKKVYDLPLRANYNLRGHRSEVALVKWNEPYQKLASCDSSGIIFVWIKYEGRWSIELINDRNTQVADFSWSHDGRMALICYQDDFVLVGSVAGQRYWSSMLNLEGTITCGIWTPDDQQVLFGTTDGQIIVMDVHGVMVAQVSVLDDITILSMAWSSEKFKMEEGDEDDTSESSRSTRALDKPSVLAVTFKNGLIYVMKNYDDVSPIVIFTGLKGLKVEWTNIGDVLAVAGCISNGIVGDYTNIVQFYTEYGILRYTVHIPNVQHPVSALTWGHNDKRLFVATGPFIHVGWVTRKVASLQLLSRLAIYHHMQSEEQTLHLLLPKRLKHLVVSLFSPTVKSCFPEPQLLRQFVCRPPVGSIRYHCTMIRHDDDLNLSSGTCYTLYLEYLGGLVPLLKGKRSSKIRPEFIIYNPQICEQTSGSDSSGDSGSSKVGNGATLSNGQNLNGLSDLSDSEYEDGCASPRMQRRRKQMKKLLKEQLELELRLVDNLAYMDTLPEQDRLVEVTSNIWGTKFKMHGVDPHLPANLGQITYKTSLLHLQPRQMTVSVTELRDDLQPEVDPSYNPNLFSEDEDDTPAPGDEDVECLSHLQKEGAPIAPMTPRKQIPTTNGIKHQHMQHILMPAVFERIKGTRELVRSVGSLSNATSFAGGDSEPDEFPYVDFTHSPELLSLIERESQSYVQECHMNSKAIAGNRCRTIENEANCCDRTDGGNCASSSSKSINSVTPPPCTRADLRLTSFVSCSGGPGNSIASPTVAHNPTCNWRLYSEASSPKRFPAVSSCGPTLSASTATPSLTCNVGSVPVKKTEGGQRAHRWAEKACDLKYIDEDEEGLLEWNVCSSLPQARLLSRCRSHSVGHLNAVDVAGSHDVTRVGSLREMKRRLILSQDRSPRSLNRPKLVQCGKSRSLDSGPVFQDDAKDLVAMTNPTVPITNESHAHHRTPLDVFIHSPSLPMSPAPSPLLSRRTRIVTSSVEKHPDVRLTCKASSLTQLSFSSPSSSRPSSPLLDRNILTSTPPTPKRSFHSHQIKNSLRRKSLLNSPLLSRRSRRGKVVESSDEEVTCSGDEMSLPTTYRDLESFQKAHIRRKLKKERLRHDHQSFNASLGHVHRREFVMHNKAPLWNENSQVYQLDFGGRVTQESAKNFQIEFRGKQVMQFGRIDGNAYTLDFQYPFTAIQAFAVALANVTQRLK